MKSAGTISVILGLIDTLKHEEIIDDDGYLVRAIQHGADRRMREPVDELRELELEARDLISSAASDLGVSVETIENLIRDMRLKIARWPKI